MCKGYRLDYFQKKYLVDATTGCWNWTATLHPLGYGLLGRTENKQKSSGRAHRVSYELHVGEIPQGLHVLHRCDNRRCVNPAHLFLGTHADNMHDMAAKGRRKNIGSGQSNGRAKLTDSMVRSIRSAVRGGAKQSDVGGIFGVSQATVSRVCLQWEFAR